MPLDHYRTLGRSGLRVSPLALGAMNFDDGSWGTAPEDAFRILDRYFDLGGNFVDTANAYNGGQSEEVLGRYFAERPERRQRAVLATKFGGTMRPDDPNAGGTSRKAIHEEIDASLRRLQIDYVDLYWMHQWDRHTPMEETLSTLDDLVRAGKVRAIGVSNTPAWWVSRAVTLAEWRDRAPIAALQDEYSSWLVPRKGNSSAWRGSSASASCHGAPSRAGRSPASTREPRRPQGTPAAARTSRPT
nr:hypothetical protein GCM10025730_05960 [Promicromonospora thailandica]